MIDDGSHFSTDILRSFIRYCPQLKPGGIYVVEDTHCLYFDSHGGGLMNESSANAFFKRLVDVISFKFWKDTTSINNHLRTFFSTKETPTFILEEWVDSIEFKNSIITIKKSHQPGHAKLGQRLLVGSVADVRALK